MNVSLHFQGNDVDAFYIPDILRALGCNCTNATCVAAGAAAEYGKQPKYGIGYNEKSHWMSVSWSIRRALLLVLLLVGQLI